MSAKHTLNVRLTPDERAALKSAAEERCVSMNLLAGFAIRDFLRRLVPVEDLFRTEPVAVDRTATPEAPVVNPAVTPSDDDLILAVPSGDTAGLWERNQTL